MPEAGPAKEIGPKNLEEIRQAIRKKYAEVAITPAGKFSYPTGYEGAAALGYGPLMQGLPDKLVAAFCGVGNPFSMDDVHPGERLLDIGCGAGFDLAVAGRLAGASGRVYGIDLTTEMVELARRNMAAANIANAEVRQVEGEEIPYADGMFDLVISNGVINLSPVKSKTFAEIHRVLKPGGRLQFADIVLEVELPEALAASPEAWSQ